MNVIPRDFDVAAAPPSQPSDSLSPSSTATQYRVQRTDTSVDAIAQQFGVSSDAIVKANPAKFATSLNIAPGDVLTIPPRDNATQSDNNTSAPATTPRQQVDKALAGLHAAEQAKPGNRMMAQDLGVERAQLQTQLDQAVDAEVQARLNERPPADTSLSPQQRKALDANMPTSKADLEASIREDIVARYKGDADIQQAVDTQEANALLKRIDQSGYNSPKDKLLALDASMQSASSDQVRTLASQQDIYRNIVKAAADWAAQPYNGTFPHGGDSPYQLGLAANDSSARYVDLLSGIASPQMRADLINDARPQLENLARFSLHYTNSYTNPQVGSTLTNLSSVVGMLGKQDQAAAQQLGSDLAAQIIDPEDLMDRGMMGSSPLLTGVVEHSDDPTLVLSIINHVHGDGKDSNVNDWCYGMRDHVFKAVIATGNKDVATSGNKVNQDVQSYAGLMGELNTLIKKEGDQMTPDQLNRAIAAYVKKKGPDWQQSVTASQQQLVNDGKALLAQEASLGAWFENHPDDAAAGSATLASLINDQGAQVAIKMAVQLDPTALQGEQGENVIGFASEIGSAADQGGRMFIKELGQNYLIHRMDGLSDQLVASNDVASRTRVIGELDKLGNDSRLAHVLGINGDNVVELKDGVAEMTKSLAQFNALSEAEKDPAKLSGQLEKGLWDTHSALNEIKGFEEGTAIGNAFRLFGVGAAGLDLAGAIDATTAPDQSKMEQTVNVTKALLSTAGFSQQAAEFVVGQGGADINGWVGKIGSVTVEHMVNYASGGLALFQGIADFANHDPTGGVLHTMTGTGAVLWAAGDGVATGEGIMLPGLAPIVLGGSESSEAVMLPALAGSTEAGMVFGPIGASMMALGTMGLMAYQNKKDNDAAIPNREVFLQGLGYTPSAADALAAWHSKDDIAASSMLMQYGRLHGQSPQQTMTWFNGLDADKQKVIAGAMLSALDTVHGDASKFQLTASSDKNWDDYAAHNAFLTGSVDHGVFGSGPGIVLNGMKFMSSADGEARPASAHQLDVALQDLLGVNPP